MDVTESHYKLLHQKYADKIKAYEQIKSHIIMIPMTHDVTSCFGTNINQLFYIFFVQKVHYLLTNNMQMLYNANVE